MLNKILCRKEGFWGLGSKKKEWEDVIDAMLSINFFLRRAWARLILKRCGLMDTVQLHPPLFK